ncbi:DsbA family protein [Streptomyces sp. P38-E01]|uniref:DsbA family protein n=1 Tax=Streptomyces tardus TaxID=2780544 RepID=A0A949JQW7_9ACTN|nr:thioredoxin domain-containing protein [Streptomyces tardus]MBU7599611.1 DsbA family protein [Streptomyces tardus]
MSQDDEQQTNARRTGDRRNARDRIRADREREEATRRRRRTLTAALAVAGVLTAAGALAAVVMSGDGAGDDSAGGGASDPITEGRQSAPVTLSVYEDFRCPGCAQFEQGFKKTINELREAGKVKVDYHIVAIVDRKDNSTGSTNAANAAACAKDAGYFTAYHDELFAHQPAESEDRFADKKHLLQLASKVEGLDTPAFRDCVDEGTHDGWVAESTKAFGSSGYDATPTLLLDGENLSADRTAPFTPEILVSKVEEAAKEAKK